VSRVAVHALQLPALSAACAQVVQSCTVGRLQGQLRRSSLPSRSARVVDVRESPPDTAGAEDYNTTSAVSS